MERNRTNAGLLALFTGFAGVHRFWLYRPGSGLAYMVPAYLLFLAYFTWVVERPEGIFDGHTTVAAAGIVGLLLLVLVSWIEAIRFFTMHPDRFRARYISDAPRHSLEDARRERIEYQTDKTKGTAGTLGVLLGWLGIQRLYIGAWATGILGLLLGLSAVGMLIVGFAPIEGLDLDVLGPVGAGLLGVLMLAGIIDGIRLWSMDEHLFALRYGRPFE